MQGGSSLYPGHDMNGPNGPRRSTITRPQFSQYSSVLARFLRLGRIQVRLARVFSLVNVQLVGSFLL